MYTESECPQVTRYKAFPRSPTNLSLVELYLISFVPGTTRCQWKMICYLARGLSRGTWAITWAILWQCIQSVCYKSVTWRDLPNWSEHFRVIANTLLPTVFRRDLMCFDKKLMSVDIMNWKEMVIGWCSWDPASDWANISVFRPITPLKRTVVCNSIQKPLTLIYYPVSSIQSDSYQAPTCHLVLNINQSVVNNIISLYIPWGLTKIVVSGRKEYSIYNLLTGK